MPTFRISIKQLIQRFWMQATPTWALVLLEGAALVAFPLVIGWAVDDLLEASWSGVLQLATLCLAILVIGAGRRFYDTRAYARIYRIVANELVAHEKKQGASLSRISARSNLFSELISFLEESIPDILQQFINLVGTLLIIALIDSKVLLACLAGMAFTVAIYRLSEQRIYRFNQAVNNEFERQVDVLESGQPEHVTRHFGNLMKWRIKLSDLETVNFSLIWIALASVLILTLVLVTSSGDASFGKIVAAVMYVFGFIESIMVLPLYFQQLIRLSEISARLAEPQSPAGDQQ